MKYYSQSHCKWAMFLIALSLPRVDSAENENPVFRRLRRQINSCQDGNYTIDGKTCCLCAAGQRLTKVCEVNPEDTECEFCEPGKTFISKPNSQVKCDPCTSCTQPNANLEVKEECTTAKDAVCRCKEGYFSLSEPRTSCNPCTKCEETGVKTSCTGTKDAVCKEKSQGVNPAVVAPVVVLMLVMVAAVAAILWWKKLFCFKNEDLERTDVTYVRRSSQKVALLEDAYLDKDGNFSKLVPAIAEVVGWVQMKNIAMEDGFTIPGIENHQLNHPKDAKEQTVSLLLEWEQKHGREAPRMLLNALWKNNKTAIAEQVVGIIKSDRNSRNQSASAS